eukprot:CAMPEP_0205819274 /NCGR_PEP_ID=MMETSP0206-20130828/1576_1 /ASSEMBLY_ACC=CAM_ASM_000279 /TAXON_ID=36767 /ORGANISM="Euplotes focardii, Strain TN1" /LENGTH=122 /DNA_ID=CAMNT_0053112665 /DNA_START=274 /DNA_END=643 /DNA_ORIENTATION=+
MRGAGRDENVLDGKCHATTGAQGPRQDDRCLLVRVKRDADAEDNEQRVHFHPWQRQYPAPSRKRVVVAEAVRVDQEAKLPGDAVDQRHDFVFLALRAEEEAEERKVQHSGCVSPAGATRSVQ